ncbi:MAG: Asp23/Gls24 family envelope stress response protein [Anaerolineales bacterium]
MTSSERPPGKTTVSPEVLIGIAKLAALGVPGVSRMAPVSGGVNRLFRRGAGDGVRLDVQENSVSVDLYLVLKEGINIREVGRNVQQHVTRAIQEMVGMNVGQVNIHIEDIAYEAEQEA